MDPILLLELTDNLNDAMAAMDAAVAADDSLAILDATDALNEALAAMDGDTSKQGAVDVEGSDKMPTLPQQQAKLLANFPVLQSFIDAAKSKGIGHSGISWDGAYFTLSFGNGGLGNSVDVAFNVSGKEKGQLTVKRWNVDAGAYEIIATFAADESNIAAALSAAEKYVSDQSAISDQGSRQLLTGIISGAINTFQDKDKLQELSDALAKDGGDNIPAGELRDLYENAIRAAGVQVLKGYGYLDAAA